MKKLLPIAGPEFYSATSLAFQSHALERAYPKQAECIRNHLAGRIDQRQPGQPQMLFRGNEWVRVVIRMKIVSQFAGEISHLVGLVISRCLNDHLRITRQRSK